MATSGEKRWPPVGIFVATSGEKPMAIDIATWLRLKPVSISAEVKRAELSQGLSDQVALMGTFP